MTFTSRSGSWRVRPREKIAREDLPQSPYVKAWYLQPRQRKGTIADCRRLELTHLLIYCTNGAEYCSHSGQLPIGDLPDCLSLSDIEPRCRCTRCGKKGAEVRPDYTPHTGGAWNEVRHVKRP